MNLRVGVSNIPPSILAIKAALARFRRATLIFDGVEGISANGWASTGVGASLISLSLLTSASLNSGIQHRPMANHWKTTGEPLVNQWQTIGKPSVIRNLLPVHESIPLGMFPM